MLWSESRVHRNTGQLTAQTSLLNIEERVRTGMRDVRARHPRRTNRPIPPQQPGAALPTFGGCPRQHAVIPLAMDAGGPDETKEPLVDPEVIMPRRQTFYGMDELFVRAPLRHLGRLRRPRGGRRRGLVCH